MAGPLQNYALTSLQKVKDALSISDTNSDTIIQQLINYNSMFAQNYCGGRLFLNQAYTEIYDTRKGSQKIFLRQRPVTSTQNLTATDIVVKYRSGIPTVPVWVVYDANGYLLYPPEGYLHFYGYLPLVHQGLQIAYTAGYLIDFTNEFDVTKHTLPEDLTWAITQLCMRDYNMRYAQGQALVMTEGQKIQYATKDKPIDNDVKNILDSYKTPHYAV